MGEIRHGTKPTLSPKGHDLQSKCPDDCEPKAGESGSHDAKSGWLAEGAGKTVTDPSGPNGGAKAPKYTE